eukprot:scaffold420_cov404-Prasinococcus_capsulatus_cf.AAC.17
MGHHTQGLAEHKETLGAPLCPCRHYDDKEAEVKDGFWNCPCVPMRERRECHCMLFLTEDNDFAGKEQVGGGGGRVWAVDGLLLMTHALTAAWVVQEITLQEVKDLTAGF